uniref:COesterase domain-containing protein n=1 Tax=Macrostomum lignano TaxID=282301 RepID=A0A1I8F227_9PLAT
GVAKAEGLNQSDAGVQAGLGGKRGARSPAANLELGNALAGLGQAQVQPIGCTKRSELMMSQCSELMMSQSSELDETRPPTRRRSGELLGNAGLQLRPALRSSGYLPAAPQLAVLKAGRPAGKTTGHRCPTACRAQRWAPFQLSPTVQAAPPRPDALKKSPTACCSAAWSAACGSSASTASSSCTAFADSSAGSGGVDGGATAALEATARSGLGRGAGTTPAGAGERRLGLRLLRHRPCFDRTLVPYIPHLGQVIARMMSLFERVTAWPYGCLHPGASCGPESLLLLSVSGSRPGAGGCRSPRPGSSCSAPAGLQLHPVSSCCTWRNFFTYHLLVSFADCCWPIVVELPPARILAEDTSAFGTFVNGDYGDFPPMRVAGIAAVAVAFLLTFVPEGWQRRLARLCHLDQYTADSRKVRGDSLLANRVEHRNRPSVMLTEVSRLSLLLLLLAATLRSNGQLLSTSVVGEVQVQHQNATIIGQEIRLTYHNNTDHRVRRCDSSRRSRSLGDAEHQRHSAAACLPVWRLQQHGRPSEDCLHLSVRSRDLAGQAAGADPARQPGVGVELGDVFSAIHGVVLATVQSRQGVLGYLSFDGVPDNLGLRDQLLAIQFLEEAVGSFGGDAARVSLAGHGNAAAAAGLLAVADGSDGSLFQRVAMLGGSIASPLAWSDSPDEAQKLGWQLANQLACNLSSPEESLNCLVAVSVEQLLLAAASVSPDGFVPLGSGEMFPNGSGGPLDLWRQGSNFSVLTGAAVNSGGPRADAALEGGQWPDVTESVFNQIVSQEFLHFPRVHTQTSPCGQNFLRLSLADWPTKKFGEAVRPLLAQAIGDFRYACPAAGDLLQAPSTEPRLRLPDERHGSHRFTRGITALTCVLLLGRAAGCEPISRRTREPGQHHDGPPLRFDARTDAELGWLNGTEFMILPSTRANDEFVERADSLPDGFGLEPGRCPMWKHEMPFHNRLCGPDAGLLTAQFDNSMAAEPKQAQEVPEFEQKEWITWWSLRNYSITVVGYGSVLWRDDTNRGRHHPDQFWALPYAGAARLGELRFANPKPLSGTSKLMILLCGTSSCRACLRDCLYLNIWTPVHSDLSEDDLPVIVFLHGGFFQFGAVSDWRGHRVLDSAKLLLVTVAYRVGAFALPVAGQQHGVGEFRPARSGGGWIRYNIEKFGGSRTKVTLMGVEAGAASIGYHLARSPVLFQRAVLLTGSPYMPYQCPTIRPASGSSTSVCSERAQLRLRRHTGLPSRAQSA